MFVADLCCSGQADTSMWKIRSPFQPSALLSRHAQLGLHQISNNVGRFDERAGREVGVALGGLGVGMSADLPTILSFINKCRPVGD